MKTVLLILTCAALLLGGVGTASAHWEIGVDTGSGCTIDQEPPGPSPPLPEHIHACVHVHP
jgi:hypothetical protein